MSKLVTVVVAVLVAIVAIVVVGCSQSVPDSAPVVDVSNSLTAGQAGQVKVQVFRTGALSLTIDAHGEQLGYYVLVLLDREYEDFRQGKPFNPLLVSGLTKKPSYQAQILVFEPVRVIILNPAAFRKPPMTYRLRIWIANKV